MPQSNRGACPLTDQALDPAEAWIENWPVSARVAKSPTWGCWTWHFHIWIAARLLNFTVLFFGCVSLNGFNLEVYIAHQKWAGHRLWLQTFVACSSDFFVACDSWLFKASVLMVHVTIMPPHQQWIIYCAPTRPTPPRHEQWHAMTPRPQW